MLFFYLKALMLKVQNELDAYGGSPHHGKWLVKG